MRTFSQALSAADPGAPTARAARIRTLGTGLGSPAEVFRRLRGARRLLFLDSSRHERGLGERSYVAFDPWLFLRMTGRTGVLEGPGGRPCVRFESAPFDAIEELWRHARRRTRGRTRPLEPAGFSTGLAGVLGYDLRLDLERLPDSAPREDGPPDLAIGLYDRVLVHEPRRGWTALGSIRGALDEADIPVPTAGPPSPRVGRFRASVTKRQHLARVREIVRRIHDGDVYQVNLSRRLTADFRGDPVDAYDRLRESNPGAYAGYLDTGADHVLSSSPERFLRVVGERVSTWPIKGTRPRSGDRVEDERLRRELRASEKDRAELAMIVDLLRNDLHRVARTGSVRVARHAFVRRYAAVQHLMSEVTAELAPRTTPVDLLRATFPGGSVTGAPKIRACEIIDELEPVRRGAYTGTMGWIGADGDVDLGILIRTVQIVGESVHVHTGGGIVADSDPAAEFAETEDKARAVLRALRSDR